MLANNGVFDAYNLKSGEEIYRQRLPDIGSGFSASPVAADGKIYLSNEDGDMLVVPAGPTFKHIATNSMGELIMATPALSDGMMYVRVRRACSRSARSADFPSATASDGIDRVRCRLRPCQRREYEHPQVEKTKRDTLKESNVGRRRRTCPQESWWRRDRQHDARQGIPPKPAEATPNICRAATVHINAAIASVK